MIEFLLSLFRCKPFEPQRCGHCHVLITSDNLVYLPIDGGPIVGPLCDKCDIELGSPC